MSDDVADGWVTSGFSRGPGGAWIEVGKVASVQVTGTPLPPELGMHDVAARLNGLELALMAIGAKARTCCTGRDIREIAEAALREKI